MAANSNIEWTHHTFNPWIGCKKVSPACAHCYAEVDSPARISRKFGLELWGGADSGAKRRVTSQQNWNEPVKWNKKAAASGRQRVFCASQSDVFEAFNGQVVNHNNELLYVDEETTVTLDHIRTRLFRLIESTPHLDWLLLTKRPENVMGMVPAAWEKKFPDNVWVGVSVENQKSANERIPVLLGIPARILFLSCEPLLGQLELEMIRNGGFEWWDALHGQYRSHNSQNPCRSLSWVIAGGESGPHARVSNLEWYRSLRDQCVGAGIPFFFKQHGEWCPFSQIPDDSLSQVEIERRDTSVVTSNSYHRIGKKLAGRLLDDVEWSQFPT